MQAEDYSQECLSPVKEGRVIFYNVGDENGDVDDAKKESYFIFKGSCVNELKDKLKEEIGLDDILVCCRNPFTAKLYPLRLQLPPHASDMCNIPKYSNHHIIELITFNSKTMQSYTKIRVHKPKGFNYRIPHINSELIEVRDERTDVQGQDNTRKEHRTVRTYKDKTTQGKNTGLFGLYESVYLQAFVHPGDVVTGKHSTVATRELGVHVHQDEQLKENELTSFRTLNRSVQVEARDDGNTSTVPEQ
ncbi:hypothetical protein LR48_Vigan10g265500 [Vigna angularis]|uniref:Uncharacterized protein n=1 Tax=Phaseolus angularis TaxID=3914 RepID=A0A0L9VP80_PHAAN|nr:hypothetical protein LR48_Vigan10g265500 [Vigna angularis]